MRNVWSSPICVAAIGELATSRRLAQHIMVLVRERRGTQLEDWIAQVQSTRHCRNSAQPRPGLLLSAGAPVALMRARQRRPIIPPQHGKSARAKEVARFDKRHAQQPGFRGKVTIDLGQNTKVLINVWESPEAAKAGAYADAAQPEHLL